VDGGGADFIAGGAAALTGFAAGSGRALAIATGATEASVGAASTAACGSATVVRSITLLTPSASDAIFCAVSRAASSGNWPDSVTTPSFAFTDIVEAFSAGSENIFPCIDVTIVSSEGRAPFPHPVASNSRMLQSTAPNRSLTTTRTSTVN
jgi:hypothetical protein